MYENTVGWVQSEWNSKICVKCKMSENLFKGKNRKIEKRECSSLFLEGHTKDMCSLCTNVLH